MEHRTPYFHYRMLRYLTLYSSPEELEQIQKDNKILHLEIDGGVYTISYNDLVEKATIEGDKLVAKHQLGNSIIELLTEDNDDLIEDEDGQE
jgi:hypothetical protein